MQLNSSKGGLPYFYQLNLANSMSSYLVTLKGDKS